MNLPDFLCFSGNCKTDEPSETWAYSFRQLLACKRWDNPIQCDPAGYILLYFSTEMVEVTVAQPHVLEELWAVVTTRESAATGQPIGGEGSPCRVERHKYKVTDSNSPPAQSVPPAQTQSVPPAQTPKPS
jgi:hypothetical protein